jgi:hypothetical protein
LILQQNEIKEREKLSHTIQIPKEVGSFIIS